jgi:hypothetical protein
VSVLRCHARLFLLPGCLSLCACEPVALALLGAGATSTVRYNLVDGVAARTFTAPVAMVRSASLSALDRMGITPGETTATESTVVITARAPRAATSRSSSSPSPSGRRGCASPRATRRAS